MVKHAQLCYNMVQLIFAIFLNSEKKLAESLSFLLNFHHGK